MKLYFNHEMGFGKMEHESMLYFPFAAVFENYEFAEALENGWFPINNKMWYQCRSTRIDISKYKPKDKILKLSKKIKFYPDVNLTKEKKDRLQIIYDKYIKHKEFQDLSLTIDDMVNNSHGHIYYVYDNRIVAFSFYKIIAGNYLSIEFAWDYENPKLSLGHISIYFEYLFAKAHRCKYIYLSAGYEPCSIYKSEYPGFEWWKGYEWSNDIQQFKNLCYRDKKVKISNFEDM